MRKNFLIIGTALLLAGSAIFPGAAADAAQMTLSGHVPKAIARLTAEGLLPETNDLTLAIGLPLRNAGVLSNLLQQMYDPTSTNFHKYLTTEEFTAQFGPTEQDYQAVIDFAKTNGFIVTGTHTNRILVDVKGRVSDVQNAFHVTFHTYRHPLEARNFFAPNVEPTVNSALPILHISGMDNYYIPRPNITPAQPRSAGSIPSAGSAPGGFYQGNDFRNAYVPGTTLTGAGQNVGLLQFDAFYTNDIAAYAKQIGLVSNIPKLVVIPIDGGVPIPLGGNNEVSLDIEMVLSMAPGVSNIYVYEAPNPSPWVDILSKMANDNLAKQLSSSWGGGPPDAVAEQIFQQMALQGQTFFNASGDSDAFTGAIPFPSDSLNITEVGGTTLTTSSTQNYLSETVWNYTQLGADGIGSCGGISPTYSIPSWQTNINMVVRKGSATMRNVPDVALTGDQVFIISSNGIASGEAGTSCAAPLWAGFTALINQQAVINGHAPIGFINPALYAIAAGTNYTNCFRDITTGDNTWSGSPNQFFATTNYDLATGLGAPNGTNLINALTFVGSGGFTNPVTHISAPLPPYGSTMSALNGDNPNGTWELFVQDDTPIDSGIISNGWSLTLTMASPVGSAADAALTMTPVVSFIPVGNNAVYSITVTNYGPTASTNVIVSDSLPTSGATFVSATPTQGTAVRSGSSVLWSIGSLASGAGAQLTLTLQTTAAGNLENGAVVSSDTSDPNPDDNVASAIIAVGTSTPPQLSGSVAGSGGAFQFTITGQSGQEYIVQASTNLVNWVPVYTNPAPYVSPFNFVDPNATNYVNRFYRVVTGP